MRMENLENQKIVPVNIEKQMKESFLDYSMSVIVSRALPDVRDGLKPVHRRILYTLYENGIGPDKAYRKSADTVGSVLGRYHPHGDMSVYDAMVRMAQDFSMRYPLVDGHGNFGSVDGDPPAAYRYTESRMSRISTYMMQDIDKETIDYQPNYDDRLQEPVVLPAKYPNLLVNGCTGIAVGMATNIPPHNLREVVGAIELLIDNPEATLDELMEHVKGPDFPTGGIIMGRAGIRAAYATGRAKITLRARANIEEEKSGKFRIVVTELPYMVNKARLIESIAGLVKDRRIEGISDLRDETDRKGMSVVIELKRDANPQIVLNKLFSYSQMQETVGIIMLALHEGVPKIMTLKEILTHYIDFQCEVITRRTRFDLKKAKEREHILRGLVLALDYIDEVIAILRAAKSVPEGKEALMTRFGLDDIQASAIVAMRLGQLTGLEREKIEDELAQIEDKIREYNEILADRQKVLALVKKETGEIRDKFADERRTEIAMVSGEVDIEDLIPVEDCVLTLTHTGYIKRQPVDTYKTQRRGGRGITGLAKKEDDFVEDLFICSSHDYVLYFTNRGKVYKVKCYEVPEGSRVSRGTNIVNLLPLEENEKVNTVLHVNEFDDDHFLTMVTKQGIVKRTRLSAYASARKGGLIAVSLDEGDELSWVKLTGGSDQLLIATRGGSAIRFHEGDVREVGRSARGVKGVTLDEGDEVIDLLCIEPGGHILTVTENGQGRLTPESEYRCQNRGGKGSINYKTGPEKGLVAGVKMVDEGDDVILITTEGVVIRISCSEIPVQSRYAGGVRVMRTGENARVATLARAPKEETVERQAEEAAEKQREQGESLLTPEEELNIPGLEETEEE